MAPKRTGRNDSALIAEVKRKIQVKRHPDLLDWTLALMRRGFSKEEAKALFFKEGYTLDSRGGVIFPSRPAIPVRTRENSSRASGFYSESSLKQADIDKTLEKMRERRKRMDAMFEAARSGKDVLAPSPNSVAASDPAIVQHPKTREEILKGLLENLNSEAIAQPPKKSSKAKTKLPPPQGDLDKRINALDSGWERLRRISREARGER